MRVAQVVLHQIEIPLREPFQASYGTETTKHAIIVEVRCDSGATGFAECVAGRFPHYTEETVVTAWHMLREWLIPACLDERFDGVSDLIRWIARLDVIRGNRMAKAGLEMALWDAWANESDTPLVQLLGGSKKEIPVGISVGLQPSVSVLLKRVTRYVEQGFQRIKLKVEPDRDEAFVRAVRREFPLVPLMVDANSAYADSPTDQLAWLDAYDLLMVEQPLGHDDLIDHADLQRWLRTPVCLDESIRSAADMGRAAKIGSCRVVNVKAGRMGGFAEVCKAQARSESDGLRLWCGGMLETGIGRLHNIALSALSSFQYPGDTAPSERYFEEDLIDPPVTFSRPGWLPVEPLSGVAGRVVRRRLERWTLVREVCSNRS